MSRARKGHSKHLTRPNACRLRVQRNKISTSLLRSTTSHIINSQINLSLGDLGDLDLTASMGHPIRLDEVSQVIHLMHRLVGAGHLHQEGAFLDKVHPEVHSLRKMHRCLWADPDLNSIREDHLKLRIKPVMQLRSALSLLHPHQPIQCSQNRFCNDRSNKHRDRSSLINRRIKLSAQHHHRTNKPRLHPTSRSHHPPTPPLHQLRHRHLKIKQTVLNRARSLQRCPNRAHRMSQV